MTAVSTPAIDTTDWGLIEALQENARLTFAELGRRVSLVAVDVIRTPAGADLGARLLGIAEAVAESEPKEEIPFMVGQVVEITEGPFSDFSGTVEEVLADKGKVKVSVSLFGRPTAVELDYLQLRGH